MNRAGVRVNQTAARVNRAVGKANPAVRIVNRTARNVIRSVHIVFNNRASVIPQPAHHKTRPTQKSPAPPNYYSAHYAFRFVNRLNLS